MNNKKVAFIICINDIEIYNECLLYINNLEIPNGYEIDVISIQEAKSITLAYNSAIKNTDAKYKVYLNETTYIINKKFIYDILRLFKDNNIGMLGVIGAKTIPFNGVWEESEQKIGKVYKQNKEKIELLNFCEIEKEYEEVKVIDGLIMVTQYDILWREDIFNKHNFYDSSQSIEFILAGYKVIVPNQIKPWCFSDKKIKKLDDYEKERKKFKDIYSNVIYPKVSVIAIDCEKNEIQNFINNQTYPNLEVINLNSKKYFIENTSDYIWEDSKNKYIYLQIVLKKCSGKYITFIEKNNLSLNNKISKMINSLINNKTSKVVLCKRSKFDEYNNIINDNNCFDNEFLGKDLLEYCINKNENLYGNLSTILFEKSILSTLGKIEGNYSILYKLNLLFNVLLNNKIILISDELVLTQIEKFEASILNNQINEYIDLCEKLYELNIISNMLRVYENLKEYIPWTYMEDQYIEFIKKYQKVLNENKIDSKFNEKYNYNYDYKVFIGKDYKYLDYKDGSEEYLYQVFKREEKISSYPIDLAKYIKDWGSQYHLTHVRTNLLHCIEELINKNDKVLELGAGMGASTNWLSNKFKEVHCIEGNINRAKALKERNKKNSNVTVFVDDLNSSSFPENNYNVITLLGVMEYLPFYSEEKPELICTKILNKIKNSLLDDGIFILAIENKMGEKYFAGCTEDHNGRIFSGINGYPEKSPITFSKKEITKMLRKSGFNNVKFYFPFPDYKLPQCIIKEDEEIGNFDVGAINRANSFEYSGYREYLMMEPLLLNSLNEAGLLFDMANSFLIICSKQQEVKLETNYLIRKYFNNGMKKEFHHYSDFIKIKDEYYVKKKTIGQGQKSYDDENLEFRIKDSKIIDGKNIIIDVYRSILNKDNFLELEKLCVRLRKELTSQFYNGRIDEDGYKLLSGNAFDFVFNNIIEKNKKWIFIDKKWTVKEEISEDYVIFRAIKNIYVDMGAYIPVFSLEEFVINIMQRIFTEFTRERYKKLYLIEEKHLNSIYKDYKYMNIQTNILNKSLEIKNNVVHTLFNEMR